MKMIVFTFTSATILCNVFAVLILGTNPRSVKGIRCARSVMATINIRNAFHHSPRSHVQIVSSTTYRVIAPIAPHMKDVHRDYFLSINFTMTTLLT